ncbi:CoA-binding domain protein [Oceanicola granulosus HTCC2516]|uniref:CoA-binding domain protein n=1 Tax=Oceanicola granulosus (strain ATCC BAA-861 / DSM 15982 / KCTC 12143 / HTCC2516) TaxID=314256 RepID=Q2CDY8_OCEGH|nr:CoA-binding protein [Oceanicola granulosus]EAR50840.1 CoA-binding domain protein [Oceanicola granulosus HTCC2516]
MHYPDSLLKDVLSQARTIAVVGFSANPMRPAHYVSRFLRDVGYRVIPVNPGLAGQSFLGEEVRAGLSDIDEAVDMIDIFRRPEAVAGVVDEALAMTPLPKVIWMQLGITEPQAAARAEAAGLTVIQDRCPKMDYPRLF